jgi:hypothetical protein
MNKENKLGNGDKALFEGMMRRAGLGKHVKTFSKERGKLLSEAFDPSSGLEDDGMDGPMDPGAEMDGDLPPEEGDMSTEDPSLDGGGMGSGSMPDLGMEPGTPPAQVTPEAVAKAIVDALKGLGLVSYEDDSEMQDPLADDGLGGDDDLGGGLDSMESPAGDGMDMGGMGGDEEVDLGMEVSDDEGDEFEEEDVQKLAESIMKSLKKEKSKVRK